jgi:hypothetical protein
MRIEAIKRANTVPPLASEDASSASNPEDTGFWGCRLDHLHLPGNQAGAIDPHPARRIKPTLFIAWRANGADLGIDDFRQIADRTGRIEFR